MNSTPISLFLQGGFNSTCLKPLNSSSSITGVNARHQQGKSFKDAMDFIAQNG